MKNLLALALAAMILLAGASSIAGTEEGPAKVDAKIKQQAEENCKGQGLTDSKELSDCQSKEEAKLLKEQSKEQEQAAKTE